MSRVSDLYPSVLLVFVVCITTNLSSSKTLAQEHPECWAQTPEGNVINLNSVCNLEPVETPVNPSSNPYDPSYLIPLGSTSNNTSTSRRRKCEYPWQLDSAGRRCGQRAIKKTR